MPEVQRTSPNFIASQSVPPPFPSQDHLIIAANRLYIKRILDLLLSICPISGWDSQMSERQVGEETQVIQRLNHQPPDNWVRAIEFLHIAKQL